jgi:hypothetical protein
MWHNVRSPDIFLEPSLYLAEICAKPEDDFAIPVLDQLIRDNIAEPVFHCREQGGTGSFAHPIMQQWQAHNVPWIRPVNFDVCPLVDVAVDAEPKFLWQFGDYSCTQRLIRPPRQLFDVIIDRRVD